MNIIMRRITLLILRGSYVRRHINYKYSLMNQTSWTFAPVMVNYTNNDESRIDYVHYTFTDGPDNRLFYSQYPDGFHIILFPVGYDNQFTRYLRLDNLFSRLFSQISCIPDIKFSVSGLSQITGRPHTWHQVGYPVVGYPANLQISSPSLDKI